MFLHKGAGKDVLVWSAKEASQLRNQYRIVGKLIGSHPTMPRQNQVMTIPLSLNEYEVTLLLEKGFASLYQECKDYLTAEVIAQRQEQFQEHHLKSFEEQKVLALEQKKADILSQSDKIVDGIIRKKKLPQPVSSEERDNILAEVINQIKPIQEQHMLVQQCIENPWNPALKEVPWSFPETEKQKIKYLIFRDLWQQEFYVTCGAKFGGDFLVYPGDPDLYHAKYIAVCQQSDDPLTPVDVVQFARLASNVKKSALLCHVCLDTEKVSYTKLDYNPI